MTPTCPKCSTQLKDDYGMVTCPGCGAIVFVDLEGVAQVASDTPEPSGISEKTGKTPVLSPTGVVTTGFPPLEDAREAAAVDFDLQPLENHGAGFGENSDANNSAPTNISEEPLASFESDTSEAGDDQGVDMNEFLGYAAEPSQNDPNDPLGLSAYANNELSGAKNGPLVVTLVISGIDAKDLRDEIRQALQDSRFGWDAAALMSSIKGGTLRIEQMSPVKATIIINRIKNLSVRIRWEQSAITEIDPVNRDHESKA
jgi:hypothetical protein